MTLTSGTLNLPPTPFPTSGRTLHPRPTANPCTLDTVVVPESLQRKVILETKLDRMRYNRVYPFTRVKPRLSMVIEEVQGVKRDEIIQVTSGSGVFQSDDS